MLQLNRISTIYGIKTLPQLVQSSSTAYLKKKIFENLYYECIRNILIFGIDLRVITIFIIFVISKPK